MARTLGATREPDAVHVGNVEGEETHVGIVEESENDVRNVEEGESHVGNVEGTETHPRNARDNATIERASARVRSDGSPEPVRGLRAGQSVPPSVRRKVLTRDGGRCVVPGCVHASFLDIHHIVPRAEGGTHHPDALVTLCSAHHRALHRGQLRVEGRVSSGLSFSHADLAPYGVSVTAVDPEKMDAATHAFQALCALGYRESQARAALRGLDAPSSTDSESVVRLIRGALGKLFTSRHVVRPSE